MKKYSLYLESGPHQRTTMVHVIDLLGCVVSGATTEQALDATPDAIRAFQRFLRQHDKTIKSDGEFKIVIVQHVMEGSWIGYGDPASGFKPDFEPMAAKDLTVYLKRLTWLQSDLLKLVRELPLKQLLAEPKTTGRSLYGILDHVAESHAVYLRYLVGKVDGMADALKAIKEPEQLTDALPRLWQISNARLQTLTEQERSHQVPHGQVTWTARRAMWRMLEHHWEHLQEVKSRLA